VTRTICTGATGYIGGAILRHLHGAGFDVQGGVRRTVSLPFPTYLTGDLSQPTSLPACDIVIHAAGLGHRRDIPAATWARANIDSARHVAAAARDAGATRFILISTAHVYGRVATGPVFDDSPTGPMDLYAQSKLDAEAAATVAFGPGVCAVRPVAVIGPGCPGNLRSLSAVLRRGLPLPLGRVRNRRSFIRDSDLAALVERLMTTADLPPHVLAAHPDSISTPDLIRTLAAGLDVTPRLWPAPLRLLAAAARLSGRSALWQSVAGSFKAEPLVALGLGWRPAAPLADQLRESVVS
jgi:nucleoside-diphosphate-sugar epimerase